MSGEWRTDFCDCCGSLGDCCIGFFLPCVEAGIAANNSGAGTCTTAMQCLLYPLLVPLLRYQVREQRGIDGNVCEDLAAGWCCPCCTTIQLKREFD